MTELAEYAKNASMDPGIYQMMDKNGRILYVGKAKNLKNRLQSYFRGLADQAPKTQVLLSKVYQLETVITDSEAEALILECILIKKHRPRYNILLKDDKSYPYLQVDYNHTFPKLMFVRRPRKGKKMKVYGPYASALALRKVLRFLNHSFQLRDCSDSEFTNRSRPCMNFQIDQCSAPCTGEITAEAYQQDLENALAILRGKAAGTIKKLQTVMQECSNSMEYERAARVRDQIEAITEVLEVSNQKMSARGDADKDVIGFYQKGDSAVVSVLFIRKGNVVESENFYFDQLGESSKSQILHGFMAQFYLTREDVLNHDVKTAGDISIAGAELKKIPREIIIPFSIDEQELLEQSLRHLGTMSTISVAEKGVKLDFVQMAEKNALQAFTEYKRERGNIYRTLGDLKIRLRLNNYPRRMECFDISNLGDTGIVASRVVFIEGRPDKSLYRSYKIRGQVGQNDFAAMKEVLERRLIRGKENKNEADELPDLIVVDGGKGQLSKAVKVFQELNITGIDVVSLAKAKTVHNAFAQEIEKSPERVFKPGRMNPIALAPDSATCHLMQRIRDEAHRFAVGLQRKQRKIK